MQFCFIIIGQTFTCINVPGTQSALSTVVITSWLVVVTPEINGIPVTIA